MRLVMMGTGPFAVPTLEKLQGSRHEVLLVVSRPARGRKGTPLPPMHTAAEQLGLELWTPESVNQPAVQERLARLSADLLVVCDYGEILKPATLAATRLGGINLHGSLLPKYRGAAPVQWAVLHGDAETGNSVIQMTPGLDAGPLLAQDRTPIDPEETSGELEERLAQLGAETVLSVVDQLAADCVSPVPQDNSAASKAPRLTKQQGLIDWSQPAVAIKNQVRGLQPWPRAFAFWQVVGREPLRVNIDRVQVVPAEELPEGGAKLAGQPPGTHLVEGERVLVATGEGMLELVEVQPAGKRRMAAGDFLRGYQGSAEGGF